MTEAFRRDRVDFNMVVAHQMLEQAGKRREPAADSRRASSVNLAHDALPVDNGAVVHLAQLVIRLDVQRLNEVLRAACVCFSAWRARSLLRGCLRAERWAVSRTFRSTVPNHLFWYGSFLCSRRSKNQIDSQPLNGTV